MGTEEGKRDRKMNLEKSLRDVWNVQMEIVKKATGVKLMLIREVWAEAVNFESFGM